MVEPKFTKRDFQFIADILYEHRPSFKTGDEWFLWRSITFEFADSLRKTNPLFDEEKFLKACGL